MLSALQAGAFAKTHPMELDYVNTTNVVLLMLPSTLLDRALYLVSAEALRAIKGLAETPSVKK